MAEGSPAPDLVKKVDFNPEPLPPHLDRLYENLAVTVVLEEPKTAIEGEQEDDRMQREAENVAIQEQNLQLQKEADMLHGSRIALAVFEAWSKKRKREPFPREDYDKKESFQKIFEECKEMTNLMRSLQKYMRSFYSRGKLDEVFSIDAMARKYLSKEEDLIDADGNEIVIGAKEVNEVEVTSDPDLMDLRREKAAIICHDLAQPFTALNSIAGTYHFFLEKGIADPDLIRESIEGIEEVIAEIPEYTDSMNLLIESESFPDGPVHIDRIVEHAESVFSKKQVHITDEAKNVVLKNNSMLWFQILFRNALKNAHEAGGDEVTFHVNLSEDKKFVEIGIRDNGPGFPEEWLRNGFEIGKTGKKDSGGTGTAMGTLRSFAKKLYPDTLLMPLNTPKGGWVYIKAPIEEA